MTWISVKEQKPHQKLGSILVFAQCGNQHVAYYSNSDWRHTEFCYESGGHFGGEIIEFNYWMPLPKPPNELEKDEEKHPKD